MIQCPACSQDLGMNLRCPACILHGVRERTRDLGDDAAATAAAKGHSWLSRAGTDAPAKLRERMAFVLDVLDDVGRGEGSIPAQLVADLAVAVRYVVEPFDLVPDGTAGSGWLDDAAVLDAVLMESRKALEAYCHRKGLDPRILR